MAIQDVYKKKLSCIFAANSALYIVLKIILNFLAKANMIGYQLLAIFLWIRTDVFLAILCPYVHVCRCKVPRFPLYLHKQDTMHMDVSLVCKYKIPPSLHLGYGTIFQAQRQFPHRDVVLPACLRSPIIFCLGDLWPLPHPIVITCSLPRTTDSFKLIYCMIVTIGIMQEMAV